MKKAVVQFIDFSNDEWSTTPTLWHRYAQGWKKMGTMQPSSFNVLPDDWVKWQRMCVNAKAQTGADVALYVIPGG